MAVALTSTVGLTVLPAALEIFSQRVPQARLSITEDAPPVALNRLLDGTLDFVIANTLADSLPAEFIQEPLFLMQLVVSARSDHPLAAATSIRELQDQRWVLPSLNRDFYSRLFESQGLEVPTRILECESFAIGAQLLGRMDLLGLFSTAAFEQELAPRGVLALPLRETFPLVEVGIVTLRNSRLTPMAQCLMECLQACPLPAGMHAVGKHRHS